MDMDVRRSPLGAKVESEGKGHILEMSEQRDKRNQVPDDSAGQRHHTSANAYRPDFDTRKKHSYSSHCQVDT